MTTTSTHRATPTLVYGVVALTGTAPSLMIGPLGGEAEPAGVVATEPGAPLALVGGVVDAGAGFVSVGAGVGAASLSSFAAVDFAWDCRLVGSGR